MAPANSGRDRLVGLVVAVLRRKQAKPKAEASDVRGKESLDYVGILWSIFIRLDLEAAEVGEYGVRETASDESLMCLRISIPVEADCDFLDEFSVKIEPFE